MARVQSIEAARHAIALFEQVAQMQPVGVSELARATELDKSRVQRILLTLHDANWITPAAGPRRRWQVSSHPLNVLRRAGRLDLLERAVVEMTYLRDEIQETAYLSAPQSGRMLVLDVAKSTSQVRIDFNPNDTFSPHSSAAVAILAALPSDSDPYSLGSQPNNELAGRVNEAKANGYAVLDAQEYTAFSTSIPDETGFPFAALTVAAPSFRLTRAKRSEIIAALKAASERCAASSTGDVAAPGN